MTTPGPSDPTTELAALLDDAAVTDAIRDRRAARDVRERAREAATWVGTLRDLAERSATVVVATEAGTSATGVLLGLAPDHLVLRLANGGLCVVAAAATVGVRVAGSAPTDVAAEGDRDAPTDATLLEVLDRWREDGAPVHLLLRGGGTERGRLRTVGQDVVSIATSAGTVALPAGAVVAATVR